MNYLLHRHRCPGHIVPIPFGLNELMADISKEVIRSQPEDIPLFVANFLESMLLTRESTRIAQTTVADIMDYAMDVATFYVTTTMPESKAKYVVNVFQRLFKEQQQNSSSSNAPIGEAARLDEAQLKCRLMEECDLNQDDAIKATKVFKEAYEKYIYRSKNYEPTLVVSTTTTSGDIDGAGKWSDKVTNILDIYKRAGPSQEEMDRAARCLQTAFRGYRTRLRYKNKTENAAIVIQSSYRSYLTRKQLNKNSEQLTPDLDESKAALAIQNIYRAYKVQKSISKKTHSNTTKKSSISKLNSKISIKSESSNTNYSSLESIITVEQVKFSSRTSKTFPSN